MIHAHVSPVQEHLYRLYKEVRGLWGRPGLKTPVKAVGGGVALSAILAVGAQLAYPQSRALPQTYIGGKHYGYQTTQQITADIATRQQRKLSITTGDRTMQYEPGQLGITLDGRKDASKIARYTLGERLIPFSFLWERREVSYYSIKVDDERAREFATSLKQFDQQPIDAEVRLENGKVSVRQHRHGYAYDPAKINRAIKGLELSSDMRVALEPETTYPKITDDMAAAAANDVQMRLQKPIIVDAAGISLVAEPAQIAGWVEFKPDTDSKELHVSYNRDKVRQWLAQLADRLYIAGRPRITTMLDGAEVSVTESSEGRALDTDATLEAVVKAAVDGNTAVDGVVHPVRLSPEVIRNYSRTSQGLQALVDYWDESHKGTWGIVLRQLDGGIAASVKPDHQFTSASVYKLYVAYVVYAKLDSGELAMATATKNGKDVSTCLDVMIVRSDNLCAEALGEMIGWSDKDAMLQAKGLGSTSIGYGRQLTTAQDAATYLIQLQNGTLMGAGHREALLHKMRNNIYRYAIPAGSPGVASANKLGTNGNFNHDVAIVYHPKGAYVLTVFTQGSDHGQIRELARQISKVMSQ